MLKNGALTSGSGPKLTPLELRLESVSRKQGAITINLSGGPASLAALKKEPINIKEGAEYSVSLQFRVNHGLISGLKYLQVVKRAGISLDKLEKMLGSVRCQYSSDQGPISSSTHSTARVSRSRPSLSKKKHPRG